MYPHLLLFRYAMSFRAVGGSSETRSSKIEIAAFVRSLGNRTLWRGIARR